MNYLEIAGTVTGLIYLWLEYKANPWLWVVGVIMPAIYIFVYYDAGLYADLCVSVYYILASAYGLVCWLGYGKKHTEKTANKEPVKIGHTPVGYRLPLIVIALSLSALIGYLLHRFTDSTVPWADGFTTGVSIVAMWMLARKYIEQWIVWIIVDVASAILYAYKGLWFTGGLYLLYALIAVAGYRKWLNIKWKSIK